MHLVQDAERIDAERLDAKARGERLETAESKVLDNVEMGENAVGLIVAGSLTKKVSMDDQLMQFYFSLPFNGKALGVLLTAPFRIKIGDSLEGLKVVKWDAGANMYTLEKDMQRRLTEKEGDNKAVAKDDDDALAMM